MILTLLIGILTNCRSGSGSRYLYLGQTRNQKFERNGLIINKMGTTQSRMSDLPVQMDYDLNPGTPHLSRYIVLRGKNKMNIFLLLFIYFTVAKYTLRKDHEYKLFILSFAFSEQFYFFFKHADHNQLHQSIGTE